VSLLLDIIKTDIYNSVYRISATKLWAVLSVFLWAVFLLRQLSHCLRNVIHIFAGCRVLYNLSPPIPLWLYSLPHWSNPPFIIFDIRALWRSGLSARAPGCQ